MERKILPLLRSISLRYHGAYDSAGRVVASFCLDSLLYFLIKEKVKTNKNNSKMPKIAEKMSYTMSRLICSPKKSLRARSKFGKTGYRQASSIE
jgi:hypothetical protein